MVGVAEHGPKRFGSTAATKRIHSPYCEAKGPIVQEGFVASRIRAFLALQAQSRDALTISHSPLMPCPAPYGSKTVPSIATSGLVTLTTTPDALHSRLPSPQSKHDIASDITTPRLASPKNALSPGSIGVRKSDATTVDTTMKEPESRRKKVEHEILSPRAIPSLLAQPSDRMSTLRQQRSVADRLGTLVERGWAAFDEMDKSPEGSLESVARVRNDPDQASHASGQRPSIDVFRKCLSLDAQKATTEGEQLSDTENAAASSARRADTHSSSSCSEGHDLRRTKKRTSWASDDSCCNDRIGEQHTRPRTPSSLRQDENDRQHQLPLADVPQEPYNALSRGDSQDNTIIDRHTQVPSTATTCAPSSSNSGSRKSSILTSLFTGKWMRTAFVDKKPTLQVLSRRCSRSILTASTHTLADCGNEVLEEKAEAGHSLAPEKEYMQNLGIIADQESTGTSLVASPEYAPYAEKLVEPTLIPQHVMSSSETVDVADTVDAPAQTFHEPSKMAADSARHCTPSPRRPQLAMNKASRISLSVPQDSSNSMSNASPRTKTQEDECLSQKGIKKVQVIVSFDGPDELVVEARIQDRAER